MPVGLLRRCPFNNVMKSGLGLNGQPETSDSSGLIDTRLNAESLSLLLMHHSHDSNEIQALVEALKHLPQATEGMLGRFHAWAAANPELYEKLKIPERVAITKMANSLWDSLFGANQKLREAGKEPISADDLKAIPADAGEEFISESEFVEDLELKERWASLLASYVLSAREGKAPRKAFSSILSQLSPYDVKCLDEIYKVDSSLRTITAKLPEEFVGKPGPPRGEDLYASKPISTVLLPLRAFEYREDLKAKVPEMELQLEIDLLASLGNLSRLGLIETHGYMNNGSDPRIVYHTGLGLSFSTAIHFTAVS
jgi:hypothetical protein